MSNRIKIMAAVLALVLGYALYDFESVDYEVTPQDPAAVPAAAPPTANAPVPQGDAMALLRRDSKPEEPLSFRNWGTRDPFFRMPIVQEEETVVQQADLDVELELWGIVSTADGSRKIAVINNDYFQLGDIIGGKKLIRIENRQVVLQDGNAKVVLQMRSAEQLPAIQRSSVSRAAQASSPDAVAGAAAGGDGIGINDLLNGLEQLPLSDEQKQMLETAGQLLQSGEQP
jgi:hypothetical protein